MSAGDGPGAPEKELWVYSYEIFPPQTQEQLAEIQKILDQENADARQGERTWTGRLVEEERVTHILIVSDTHLQQGSVNGRLQHALRRIDVSGSLTIPMQVLPGARPPQRRPRRQP